MLRNITSTQLLLIALAGVLLLLAAFTLILSENPSALPAAVTSTAALPSATPADLDQSSPTPIPTRQTSYTPFATLLTPPGTPAPSTVTLAPGTLSLTPSQTIMPGVTSSLTPTRSSTPLFTNIPSSTHIPGTASITPSPTVTHTLSPGEIAVNGRVLKNGTPVANVIVEFKDDVAPRQSATNPNGTYTFITLAPGSAYRLTFYLADNPQLTPLTEVASLAWMDGTLPINTNPITLPDLDVSLDLNGMLFELQTPLDGASFSASVISSNNPIQFVWTLYGFGGSYHIELGRIGSDQPLWTSHQIANSYFMWDGTLDDGTHITAGNYWWRVAVTMSAGNSIQDIFTQLLDIIFIP